MVLVLFLLTGCGTHVTNIDVEFQDDVESFVQDASKRDIKLDTTNLSVTGVFSIPNLSSGQKVLGSCTLGQKIVKINKEIWNDYDRNIQKEVIYHELGHCLLNRMHNNKRLLINNYSVPASIMNESVPSFFYNVDFYGLKERLVDELFGGE